MQERWVVLDTETTGLKVEDDHRLVEIGALEIINRKLTDETFHYRLNPHRDIDKEAVRVHGITRKMLDDDPEARDFAGIADEFLAFIADAEIIIHNMSFDIGFLDAELRRAGKGKVAQSCAKITDSLALARRRHPGQKNNLDALCERYEIDTSARTLHGALLDAQLLAKVYLAMTGGQISLLGGADQETRPSDAGQPAQDEHGASQDHQPIVIVNANQEELAAHTGLLKTLGQTKW